MQQSNTSDAYYDYSVIIPHPREDRILLFSTPSGWELPGFVPEELHVGVVDHINRAMKEKYGLDITILRCIYDDFDARTRTGRRVYAADNHTVGWMPPTNAVWIARSALNTIRMALPESQAVLEEWFSWMDKPSPLRVAWSNRKWFAEATDWIDSTLQKLGYERQGDLIQIRSWVRSCTLHVPTNKGHLFFKAVPTMFSYEPVVTRVLAQRYPSNAPEVIAVDVVRSWMLMKDIGGVPLSQVDNIIQWEEAMRHYALIQIDMAAHTQNLISLGCPDRHIDNMVSQLDRLVADTAAMFPGTDADLTSAEADLLNQLLPKLKSMCWKLLDYGIPLTLEHGDFWAGNIIAANQKYIYFDWSDSSISHPFFDMVYFLDHLERGKPAVENVEQRLLDIYLEAWQNYEGLSNLKTAFEIARPLAALHRALVYHRVILPSIEPRAKWEMENELPTFIRLLLQRMRELESADQ